MNDLLENILTVITAISGLLIALWRFSESPVGRALVASLRSRDFTQAKELLAQEAFAVVAKYQQTLVDGIKQDALDNKITKEELKARLLSIKKMALQDLKSSAGGGAILQALETLGIKDIDAHLEQLLEAAIVKMRGSGGGLSLPLIGQPSGVWASVHAPSEASVIAAKNDLKGLVASDQTR